MKNIDIRKYVIENFKDDNKSELKESINDATNEDMEEALPGLGVFMEIIWKNADENLKNELIEIIKAHLS